MLSFLAYGTGCPESSSLHMESVRLRSSNDSGPSPSQAWPLGFPGSMDGSWRPVSRCGNMIFVILIKMYTVRLSSS